jgi:MFS family permease
MGALAAAPNQPAAFAAGILMGLASITFMTTSTAIVQLRADPTMRGRVLALQAIVFLGSTPIGAPVVGAIAEGYGARWAIALGALAAVVAGVYGLATVRRAAARQLTDQAAAAGADAGASICDAPLLGPAVPSAGR